MEQRMKAECGIDAVRIGSTQRDTAHTGEIGMIEEPLHHAPPQSLTSHGFVDPHIGVPGFAGLFGVLSRVVVLFAFAIGAEAMRTGYASLDQIAGDSRRPIA